MNIEHKRISQHIHRALGTELLCTVLLSDESISVDYLAVVTSDLITQRADELVRQIRTDFIEKITDLRIRTLGYSQAATLIRQGDPVVFSIFLHGMLIYNTRETFINLHHLAQKVDTEGISQEQFQQMLFQRAGTSFQQARYHYFQSLTQLAGAITSEMQALASSHLDGHVTGSELREFINSKGLLEKIKSLGISEPEYELLEKTLLSWQSISNQQEPEVGKEYFSVFEQVRKIFETLRKSDIK